MRAFEEKPASRRAGRQQDRSAARRPAPALLTPVFLALVFFKLALFTLAPAPVQAQTPGAPITTTPLAPAASEAETAARSQRPEGQPAPGGDAAASGGRRDTDNGAAAEPASSPSSLFSSGADAQDPRETRSTGADATRGPASAADSAADFIGAPEEAEPQAATRETSPAPRPEAVTDAVTGAETETGTDGRARAGTGAQDTASRDTTADAAREQARDGPPAETAPAETPVREMLAGLWRAAVASGETTHGFEVWLAEALGGADGAAAGTGRSAAPALPARMPSDQAGRTRLASERWLARAGPVALGDAGRVVTTFGSAIPTVFCAPLMVCYIELEPGEVITGTPSWGDTARWQVGTKVQGFDPETVLVEVKPAADAQLTNIVIPTDRRVYTINLVNDPDVHTPILSFLYPDSAARAAAEAVAARDAERAEARAAEDRRKAQAAAARSAELARSGVTTQTGTVAAERLDFGFRVEGKAPFRPVRVFADGRRTYIDLHPEYRGAMPVIVAGPGEGNAALNTRVTRDGTRLVADRVITDIWLQSGRKRVRIRKADS